RNWGVGDFTDLVRLVEFGAENGAAFVGLNPLHSALTAGVEHTSPYDPSSRLFLNTIYLDVEAIPEFAESQAARDLVADEQCQAELRSLRAAELVAYPDVVAVKFRVLELLFASFCEKHKGGGSQRASQFEEFRRSRGESLRRYATFQVVHEYLSERDPQAWGWPAWPEEFRDWRSTAVANLLASREQRLRFFMYLQWNAASQLAAAAARAEELGMPIGIYADLALSSKYGGADTWADRELYVEGARIGAPPDNFNQAGQDWGLPPWNPRSLRTHEYTPFIDMLRANMLIGGALRIDHVMSLLRCYLIPPGAGPADGAYVYYAFEEMRAILALESQRNQCLVIGEDLGTVPDEVRCGLGEIGVLGYRVLFFEKRPDGSFKLPEEFDTDVLTVISTHDLPTLVGFWQGADIDWRRSHDLYARDEDREQQILQRAEDRARLLMALEKEKLLPAEVDTGLAVGVEMTLPLRCAFHRYLSRSSSRLAGVQVEDLLGEREQANLPGTTTEHPNWRRRVSLQIEAWRDEPQVQAIVSAMQEERPCAQPQRGATQPEPSPHRASIPRATYRVQLHKEFGFADLERVVPYLAALGVSHVYCSPYMKARSGSNHGYDIVDHNALNPELGDRADFDRLCRKLEACGMSQILDMVPNHMAITGHDHDWWLDVLENGPASRYAEFFDIDWQPLKEELRGKVLLPVLGDHYGNILEHGELELVFDAARGSLAVEYYEHHFPIDPREYPRVLEPELELLRSRLDEGAAALVQFESLITAFGNLPPRTSTTEESRRERARDQKLHQNRLAQLVADAPDIRQYVTECLRVFNGDEQYPADTSRLHQLLEAQAYRLAYWRVASHEINYRRFFDINDLASIRMENPEVFEATHQLVFELIADGTLQGLRIDHPDGLYDPRAYFRALQERSGLQPDEADASAELPLYLVAEKILAGGETLRDDWPIHGTTGYEFANLVNRFLVRPEGLAELEFIYADFIGRTSSYQEILHRSKSLIMRTSLASELNVLVAELDRMAEQDPHTRDFGLGGLRNALFETVACFPVYRTYIVEGEMSEADAAVINHAIDAAKALSEAADTSVFEFLRDLLLNRSAIGRSPVLQERIARFGMRLQQYTSPVAAKGMEDTAFYRYGRLISLNEVGGTPELPAASVGEFHAANRERQKNWPHSMLASSTHDTKRSEDVRARLHVLSEIAVEWRQRVQLWARINEPLTAGGDAAGRVDSETEYFLYQTLVGAWPIDGARNRADSQSFSERIGTYMIKAVKEAKRRTSWLNPDPQYEDVLQSFVAALLDPASNADFMAEFLPFQRRVARLGFFNSLTQLVLKFCCPGVPDIYQGNEFWRFDLVDPDNRRPIDFERRRGSLEDLRQAYDQGRRRDLIAQLLSSIEDGGLKLFIGWRLLSLRNAHPKLFERSDYYPLRVSGSHADHVCAFARSFGDVTLIVAVARWFSDLLTDDGVALDAGKLADTAIDLPPGARSFIDGFTSEPVDFAAKSRVQACDMFASLPVAAWIAADSKAHQKQ
ncbi:MAG: malto-oligosyltrehalose synthase, partial [Woeseia sp.]